MRLMKMIAPAVAALLAGCTIADVAVAPGEDRLVVEGVLRTDWRAHFILVLHGTCRC